MPLPTAPRHANLFDEPADDDFPTVGWRQRVHDFLFRLEYTVVARAEILAHIDRYKTVECCPVICREDRQACEALLDPDPAWGRPAWDEFTWELGPVPCSQ